MARAARSTEVDLDALERPLAAREALAAKAAQVATYTVPQFLLAVDGMTVQTLRAPSCCGRGWRRRKSRPVSGPSTSASRNPASIGRVLHAVATPSMVYVLLVLGLAAIAFELTQPGFGFAGFSGVALASLAGYGLTVAVPSWGGLGLLVLGIGLLVLDVRLRSLSWPTWVGLAAFGAGSILAWRHVDDSIAISPWLIAGAVLASLLYYGFALTVALQSRDRIVGTQRGLVGLVGEARRTPGARRSRVREGCALAGQDGR